MSGEIRLGLVGGGVSYHGRAFAGIINGINEAELPARIFPVYAHRPLGARVSAIYFEQAAEAATIARVTNIDKVAKSPQELIDHVDGVLVVEDCSMEHQRLANTFLNAGMTVFIDKPLAPTVDEAEGIFARAIKGGATLMSTSAARYSARINELKRSLGAIDPLMVQCFGMNEIIYYGVHAVEALVTLLGPGATAVRALGDEAVNLVEVHYPDKRRGALSILGNFPGPLCACAFGKKGCRLVEASDLDAAYGTMLETFVEAVRARKPPVEYRETLEVVKLTVAVKEAILSGERIEIAPSTI
jgi:predicted dehydrogenase